MRASFRAALGRHVRLNALLQLACWVAFPAVVVTASEGYTLIALLIALTTLSVMWLAGWIGNPRSDRSYSKKVRWAWVDFAQEASESSLIHERAVHRRRRQTWAESPPPPGLHDLHAALAKLRLPRDDADIAPRVREDPDIAASLDSLQLRRLAQPVLDGPETPYSAELAELLRAQEDLVRRSVLVYVVAATHFLSRVTPLEPAAGRESDHELLCSSVRSAHDAAARFANGKHDEEVETFREFVASNDEAELAYARIMEPVRNPS